MKLSFQNRRSVNRDNTKYPRNDGFFLSPLERREFRVLRAKLARGIIQFIFELRKAFFQETNKLFYNSYYLIFFCIFPNKCVQIIKENGNRLTNKVFAKVS